MTIVYLAGAIDMVNGDNRTTWRDKVTDKLREHGIAVYNPVAAFGAILTNEEVSRAIVNINTAALKECSHILFVMGNDYPSVGTPIELYMAHQLGLNYSIVWNPSPTLDLGFGHEKLVDGDLLPIYVRHFAGKKPIYNGFGGALASIINEHNRKQKPRAPRAMAPASAPTGRAPQPPAPDREDCASSMTVFRPSINQGGDGIGG